MQKTRARKLISALAILMGEGRKEKIPSLLALPSVQVPAGPRCECQRGLRGGSVMVLRESVALYPQEAGRNWVGQNSTQCDIHL